MDVRLPIQTYWQPKLGSLGEVVTDLDDIAQCIRTILHTLKGSVALEPDLGLSYRWLDRPITEAIPELLVEIGLALRRFEPRITLLRRFVHIPCPGLAVIALDWAPKGAATAAIRQVLLLGAVA